MKVNPSIFKAYDIRGKYPAEINEEVAEIIGSAAAVFLSKKYRKSRLRILICRDVRTSSKFLRDAIVRGVISQGHDVLDAGIGTTPYFYYLTHAKSVDGGIMITASHNPPIYNGFKISGREGKLISVNTGLGSVKKLVVSGRNIKKVKITGQITFGDYYDEYLTFISKRVNIERITAVIDAAGGSAAILLPKFLSRFPQLIYKPIFFNIDGSFKKHPPNPLDHKSQKIIESELKNGGFRLGVVFDGDADRVVFFDEKGNPVKPDYIAALLAEAELKRKKGAWFVFPINISKSLREFIKERGGRIKLTRVGYTFVHQAMKKMKAVLGAEVAGHFHFKDFFYSDSALMAFIRVVALLSRTNKSLSHLVKPLERYVSSPGEINFHVTNKKKVLNLIKRKYSKGKISLLDGLTIEFPDWWFNLRPSNTEPVVRLVLEAKTQKLFDERLEELRKFIR